MIKVLFVCLGNICRSPMAEGLFIHKIKQVGLDEVIEVDSAGTGGWHAGEQADSRMRATAARHDVDLPSRARKLLPEDLGSFDYVIPMDQSNYREIITMKEQTPEAHAAVMLMRDFGGKEKGLEVPDPYYGGKSGFENVYQILDDAVDGLVSYIREEHGL